MVLIQIQLQEQQVRNIRKVIAKEHISMTHFIRRAIDAAIQEHSRLLHSEARREKALAAIGCLNDPASDLAAKHDRYLQEVLTATSPDTKDSQGKFACMRGRFRGKLTTKQWMKATREP